MSVPESYSSDWQRAGYFLITPTQGIWCLILFSGVFFPSIWLCTLQVHWACLQNTEICFFFFFKCNNSNLIFIQILF